MLPHYYTIKQDGQSVIEIKKSRFICTLQRIESEEEAKELIQALKKEHWKANHNCHAYVLGDNQDIQRSSDDGEPSGTAGVPMLEVLKVKELRNVIAVVTRYFGGTKLGAGGLIRAYSQSVSSALEEIGLVKGMLKQGLIVTVDYGTHGKLEHYINNNTETIILDDTLFTDKVTVTLYVDEEHTEKYKEDIINLLSNQCTITQGKTKYVEVDLPL